MFEGVDAKESAVLSTIFDLGGIIGGVVAGTISDKTGNPASTCGLLLVIAVPTMFIYQSLVQVGGWCPILAVSGITWNILLTLATGLLVNGPYALITTAVSAELGM